MEQFDALKNLKRRPESIRARNCWDNFASHLFDLEEGLHRNAEIVGSDVGGSCDELDKKVIIFVEHERSYLVLSCRMEDRDALNKVSNLLV